jgi:hypothetical protein
MAAGEVAIEVAVEVAVDVGRRCGSSRVGRRGWVVEVGRPGGSSRWFGDAAVRWAGAA